MAKFLFSYLVCFISLTMISSCSKEDKPILGTASLTGTIIYSNSTIPVSGVIVEINGKSGTTGSDGKYLIEELTEGNHTLKAAKVGFDSYSTSLQIKSGINNLDIEFTSADFTHNLSGEVFSNNTFTGKLPVKFCQVVVLNPDGTESNLKSQTSITGYYQIPTVPQGTRTIRFTSAGFEPIEIEIFMANSNYNLDMEMKCIDCPEFIGQFYEGGWLFHVYQSGEQGYVSGEIHGLISSQWDLFSNGQYGIEWGCWGTIIGASNAGLGGGLGNSLNISQKCNQPNIAATRCLNLVENNYSDWYLPSKGELDLMHKNLFLQGKGNFSTDVVYWSSTESMFVEAQAAYGRYFPISDGANYPKNINNGFKGAVRPIRAF